MYALECSFIGIDEVYLFSEGICHTCDGAGFIISFKAQGEAI